MSTNLISKDKVVDVARSVCGGYMPPAPGFWQADFTLGVLPAGVNFSRASSGVYVDNTGTLQTVSTDIPRFGYNPSDLSPRGLLLEGTRTNSLFNSTAPATQIRTLAVGTYVLWLEGSGSCVVAAGSATGTGFGTATAGYPVVFNVTVTGTCSFSISGTVTRFQCEKGNFPSSFIATTGAAATRSMDLCTVNSLATIGYNETEWTVIAYFELLGLVTTTIQRTLQFSDGTTTNRCNLGTSTANTLNASSTGSVSLTYAPAMSMGTIYKTAAAFKANDNALSVNGTLASTDTSSTQVASMNLLGIGFDGFGSNNPLYGFIRKLVYYPSRLSNSQLQSLTS